MFGFSKKKKQVENTERPIRNDLSLTEIMQNIQCNHGRGNLSTDDMQSLLKILGNEVSLKNAEWDGQRFTGGSNMFKIITLMICQLYIRVKDLELLHTDAVVNIERKRK